MVLFKGNGLRSQVGKSTLARAARFAGTSLNSDLRCLHGNCFAQPIVVVKELQSYGCRGMGKGNERALIDYA
jgi:hypothetical protein